MKLLLPAIQPEYEGNIRAQSFGESLEESFGLDQLRACAPLRDSETLVFFALLDGTEAERKSFEMTLSPEERGRLDRYVCERERGRFVVCRGLLRGIIGCYLGVNPQEVKFDHGPKGKPSLAAPLSERKVNFSVAHSGGVAAYCLVLDVCTGIDLEYERPISEMDEIARLSLAPREMELFKSLPDREKRNLFFRSWVSKESYLKAVGTGLTRSLTSIEVSPSDAQARFVFIDGNASEATKWFLTIMRPGPHLVAAITAPLSITRVHAYVLRYE